MNADLAVQPVRARVRAPGRGAWFEAETLEGTPRSFRVRGVAPGDLVELRPKSEDPPWAELDRLVLPGAGRRTPPCHLSGECGGCHWQQIDEATQLDLRVEDLRRALAQGGAVLDSVPLSRVTSPLPFGYRFRARFQVDSRPGSRRVGFHVADGRRVVDVPSCPLLAPELARTYAEVRDALLARPIAGLTGIELLALPGASGGLALLNPRDAPPPCWPDAGESLLQRVGDALTGVAVRFSRADPRPRVVGSQFLLGTTERGRPVAATAGGFLQANLNAAERLADELVRLSGAGGARRCIELYAGTGLFGWRLAEQGADVRAYELDAASVAAARALPAPRRGALVIVRADAADALRLADVGATDVVVADPPRSGLGPVARLLGERKPRRVVLVSCSTRSLRTDVGCLIRAGYRVREAVAIDLFPQTRHLESLVRLDA